MIDDKIEKTLEYYLFKRKEIIDFVKQFSVKPRFVNQLLTEKGTPELKQGVKLYDIILRPQISIFDLIEYITPFKTFLERVPEARKMEIIEGAEISIKYEGYIGRQRLEVERQHRLAGKRIPTSFDYDSIGPLRNEAREKLSKIRPLNLDQAKRISGITPADLALVLAHMESKRKT